MLSKVARALRTHSAGDDLPVRAETYVSGHVNQPACSLYGDSIAEAAGGIGGVALDSHLSFSVLVRGTCRLHSGRLV